MKEDVADLLIVVVVSQQFNKSRINSSASARERMGKRSSKSDCPNHPFSSAYENVTPVPFSRLLLAGV